MTQTLYPFIAGQRAKLSIRDRKKIWELYQAGAWKVSHLAEEFCVSRPTIYKVLERARNREFYPRKSTNLRYRCIKYGLKRLARIEYGFEKPGRRMRRTEICLGS